MAANMYDQPAQAKFIDTYVPIPFQELYTLGTQAKQDVEKAVQDLSGKIQTWSQFKSPSSKDTQNFYNLTIGAMADDIERLAANPDLLKTQEGRHAIQSKINNLDYKTLSNIKQSADNLSERLKSIEKMKADGLYKESWDDINVSQWDTVNKGIMNSLSPTKYVKMHDLADPYASQLKPTFYKGRNPITGEFMPFTNWEAITENDIKRTLSDPKVIRDVLNTPQGKYHYRDVANAVLMANPKATQEDILNAFSQELVNSQKDRMRANPVVDQVGLAMWKKQSAKTPPSTNIPFTEQLSYMGNQKWNNAKLNAFANMNPTYYNAKTKELESAMAKGDTKAYNDILNDINSQANKLSQKDIVGQFFDKNLVTGKDVVDSTNKFINTFAQPIMGLEANNLITKFIPGATKEYETDFGKAVKVSNLGTLTPVNMLAATMAGRRMTPNSASIKLQNVLRDYKIPGVHLGNVGYVTLQNSEHPTEGDNRVISEYAISKQDLLKAGLSEGTIKGMIRAVGGQLLPKKDKLKLSNTYDESGSLSRSTAVVNTNDDYYVIKLSSQLPYTSDIQAGSAINNEWDAITTGTKGKTELYPSRQQQALEVELDNLFPSFQ